LAELTEKAIQQPDKAGEHVTQIATASRAGLKSLDEIVWAVNPRNDTLQDLLDYAGQYAVDYLQAAGIRCRVDFPPSVKRDIAADVRHGLFLAVKEALHNVVKHAQAKEVRLCVTDGEAVLRLVVEDDGLGFNDAPDDALADGLRNMRQRLAEMGGVCSIESRPGAGARICFEVPWRK
jgi:signal transduction histidine kinase